METTETAGYLLFALCILLWVIDIYLSHKLKSHLTPKDSYQKERYNEQDDYD